MQLRTAVGNPSQIMIEQLAASGVKYVFYNSGSREARFFDALHDHRSIHGILALHEGSVTAMAGGYAQANLDPAVAVVHLGAGLAQCLGQMINVWWGGLPVVMITFAGDTGSFGDRIGLDLNHSFGPTSISTPFTKASWTVIEPEGLAHAIRRALLVASTPPIGPVHLAIYDRVLGDQQIEAQIADGAMPQPRAGCPSTEDVEELVRALLESERPVLHTGDGVWKSAAGEDLASLADAIGAPIVSAWGDARSVPPRHPMHCGRFELIKKELEPDLIVCIGLRTSGRGDLADLNTFSSARRVIAIGPDVANLKNIPNLDLAILGDERRTLESVLHLVRTEGAKERFGARRSQILQIARSIRERRKESAQRHLPQAGCVRPSILRDALDHVLACAGGAHVMLEQFALPLDDIGAHCEASSNVYVRAAGGSEGYGVGGAIGLKLGVHDRTVVGVVGDGSLYYADSGLWTAAHHGIPVLFVIPNNQSYGIVADSFGNVDGTMKQKGEYDGVALQGIDPVKIAEGFGLEGIYIHDEARLMEDLSRALECVQKESRPILVNVHLPLGLPHGSQVAAPFMLT